MSDRHRLAVGPTLPGDGLGTSGPPWVSTPMPCIEPWVSIGGRNGTLAGLTRRASLIAEAAATFSQLIERHPGVQP
jgi:hypothetical protein